MTTRSGVLLDCFSPPQKAGQLVSFLGSSYEFDADFLQKDLIPTLLNLRTRSQDQTITPATLEYAASQSNFGIVLDHSHYRESGIVPQRIDVVTPIKKQHSKVALIHWQNCIRAIISSANLTTNGCRRNREVACALDFDTTSCSSIDSLRAVIAGFRSRFGNSMTKEMAESLGNVLDTGEAFAKHVPRVRGPSVLWGGDGKSVLRQITDLWPPNERVTMVHIVSPFWPTSGSAPFDALHDLLADSGCIGSETDMNIYCSGTGNSEGPLSPEFPYEAKDFLERWKGCNATLHPVDDRVLPSDVPDGFRDPVKEYEGRRGRSLHAKIIALVGEEHILVTVGSANFTVKGLVASNAANIEAQAAWVLPRKTGEAWFMKDLLPPINGSIDLASCSIQSLAAPRPPEPPQPWPDFIDRIELTLDRPIFEWADGDEVASLIATHRLQDDQGPVTINIDSFPVLSLSSCTQLPCENKFRLSTQETKAILLTREVGVRWPGVEQGIRFPVNLTSSSKAMIPIQNLMRPLTEDQLVLYYKGMMSTEQLVELEGAMLNVQSTTDGDNSVDPTILQVYKVREFVESLPGLREELLNSTRSSQSMRRAFLAEISPLALAKTILGSYKTKERSSVASAFQLLQLVNVVNHVPLGNLDEGKREVVSECLRRLQEIYNEIKEDAGPYLREEAFQKFEAAMLQRRVRS
jgi:hypothetical protein